MLLADQDRDASGGQIERRDRGLGPGQGGDFPFDKAGIDLAACHHRMDQQRLEKIEVGGHADNLEPAQSLDQAFERLGPIGSPGDQLRQQRIVVGRDRVAGAKAGVDADAFPSRLAPLADGPGRRQKTLVGVFGVNPGLDRMAPRADLVLPQRQRLAERDPQLPLHEVDTGDHLGDGMLDLQTRVHLDEIEPVRVGDEFDGAGADIAGGLGGRPRRSRHLRPPLGRDADRGRLFDHLLMTTLKRAFALE